MYQYKATLRRVVDGDTVDFDVDLGFYMTAALRFRILGVDTPELRGGTDETKAKAKEAKAFVEKELGNAMAIFIETHKADSFGRWLANVEYWCVGDEGEELFFNLADQLIEAGLGVVRD
jgi:micrococcal nuclease